MFEAILKRSLPHSLVLALLVSTFTFASSADIAAFIHQEAKPHNSRGVLAHIGCGSGWLTVELSNGNNWVVHAIEEELPQLRDAQNLVAARGKTGLISVEHGLPNNLPYIENLINFVVVDDYERLKGLDLSEVYRVLANYGVAFIGAVSDEAAFKSKCTAAGIDAGNVTFVNSTEKWARIYKPRPSTQDDWSHYRHGPDNNPVSNDMDVGPTHRIRWRASKAWEREARGGNLFYKGRVFDGGRARDANSGILLWETSGSVFAAEGDVALLDRDDKIVSVNINDGQDFKTYENAAKGPVKDGVLYGENGVAVNLQTGAVLWTAQSWPTGSKRGTKVAVGENNVFANDAGNVAGYRRSDGARLWGKTVGTTTAWHDIVYYSGLVAVEIETTITILSAADGSQKWKTGYSPAWRHSEHAYARFADNLLWLTVGDWTGYDPQTGEVKRSWGPCYGVSSDRCAPAIASGNYIIGASGNFLNYKSGETTICQVSRNACNLGTRHANGLQYTYPNHCGCYRMLRGFIALAPDAAVRKDAAVVADNKRLEQGIAYGMTLSGNNPGAKDWPTYRHDDERSGSSSAALPGSMKALWTITVTQRPEGMTGRDWDDNMYTSGALTAPVVSGEAVYIAAPDAHQVVSYSTRNATVRWCFTAGSRIIIPPTIYQGLVLFGCQDGYVYCVRDTDGALVWRFLAAPRHELIVASGQVESQWPVMTGIVVSNGTACFGAGRSTKALGGISYFGLDPATGAIKWKNGMDAVETVGDRGIDKTTTVRATGANIATGRIENIQPPVTDLFVKVGSEIATAPYITFNPADGNIPVINMSKIDDTHDYRYSPPKHSGLRAGGTHSYGYGSVLLDRMSFKAGNDRRRWAIGSTSARYLIFSGAQVHSVPYEKYPSEKVLALAKAGSVVYKSALDANDETKGILTAGSQTFSLPGMPVFDGMAAGDDRLFVALQNGKLVCFGDESNNVTSIKETDNIAELDRGFALPSPDKIMTSDAAVDGYNAFYHPVSDVAKEQSDARQAHNTSGSTSLARHSPRSSTPESQEPAHDASVAVNQIYPTQTVRSYMRNAHTLSGISDETDSHSCSEPVKIDVITGEHIPPSDGSMGGVLCEYWVGMDGADITDLTSAEAFPLSPTGRHVLKSLECPESWADNFGARISGLLYAPVSGSYRFRLAANTSCDVSLSSDAEQHNASIILMHTNDGSQELQTVESGYIDLEGGQSYFIEVLQKDDNAPEYCAVSWSVRDAEWEIIPGRYLSPRASYPE